jgi:precorrin-6B methylase 2
MTPLFSKVPFVPVRKKVLADIISSLNLSNESILYDLGCGDGRILFAAAQVFPGISCIGIEKAPFPFLWAKVRQLFSGNKKISLIRGDMFKADVSPATHIFLYLFPELMDALLMKFKKELKPGTRVVSCDFQFSDKKPDQILNLKVAGHQLNRKLYIYNF